MTIYSSAKGFPDPNHPLKTDSEDSLRTVRQSLREAFDRTFLTQEKWVRALGKSDRHCFTRWMENPGLLSAEQVHEVCHLGRVTIDYLRYGEHEAPDPESELYERYRRDLFEDFDHMKSSCGALTIDKMRDLYSQLNARDRHMVSELAWRLHIAELDDESAMWRGKRIEELTARLAEYTGDYTYFAGKDASEEEVDWWRHTLHDWLARKDAGATEA